MPPVRPEHPDRPNPYGLHELTDPHWKPQALLLSMKRLKPFMTHIIPFSRYADESRRVIEKLGLWKRYGQSGLWDDMKNSSMFEVMTKHSTASQYNASWATPEIKKKVLHAYRDDYELFSEVLS